MNQELAELCEQDQTDLKAQVPWREKRDRERRIRVMEIFKGGGFSEGVDYTMAALIFQHGEKLDDWWIAYEFARKAAELGTERSKWLGAAAYDRWLLGQRKPIRYGTQLVNFGGIYRLPALDGHCTDADRVYWELPSEEDQFAMNRIVGMQLMKVVDARTVDNLTIKVITIDRTLVFGDVFGERLRQDSEIDFSMRELGEVRRNSYDWRWIYQKDSDMAVWWLPMPMMPGLGHCIVHSDTAIMGVSKFERHAVVWVNANQTFTGYLKAQDKVWAVSGRDRNRVEIVIMTLLHSFP